MTNYIKNNLLSLIILSLFVFIMINGKGYFGFSTKVDQKPDTVRSVSVQYIPQPQVQVPQYQPIIIESKQPVAYPQTYEPSKKYEELLDQYRKILEEFMRSNVYKDSIGLHDSSGNKVGTVFFNDVVTQNKITQRSPAYKLQLPHTTITQTITKYQPQKRQFYIGGEIMGSQSSIFNGISAGLLYKNRKDKISGIEIGLANNQPFIGLKSYWKIKLSKK